MRRSPRACVSLATASALMIWAAAGCAPLKQVRFDECCAVPYEQLEVHYELDGYRGGYWSRALSMAPRLAEDDPAVGFPEATQGVTCQRAEIHILYPHPECQPGMARAIVRLWHRGRPVDTSPPRASFGRTYSRAYSKVNRRHQLPAAMVELSENCADPKLARPHPTIYALDIQRVELDLLMPDLVCSGYFRGQSRPNGGARLIVEVNGQRHSKEWTPEPRLDDILTRVSTDGRRILDTPEPSPLVPKPVHVPEESSPGRIQLSPNSDVLPEPPPPGVLPEKTSPPPVESSTPESPNDRPGKVSLPLPPEPVPSATTPELQTPPFEDPEPDDVLPPPLQGGDAPRTSQEP